MKRGYHMEIGDALEDNHKYIYVVIYIEPNVVKDLEECEWEPFIDRRLSDAKVVLLKHLSDAKVVLLKHFNEIDRGLK